MIVNIQKGGFIKGIIDYHEKKVEAGKGQLLYDNMNTATKAEKINTYLETAELNPKIYRNKFMHIAVSFNKEDRSLDTDQMVKIGERYLAEMGITDTPVLMYEHADSKHRHFHIVTTTMDLTGKKINDFNDHFRSQQLARRFEKELGLTPTEYTSKQEQKLQEINVTKFRILNSIASLEKNPKAMAEIEPLLPTKLIEEAKLNALNDYEIQKKLLARGIDKEGINQIYRILTKHNLVERTFKQQLLDQLSQIKLLSKTRDEFITKAQESGIYVRKIVNSNSTTLTFGLPQHNFYAKEKQLPVAFRYDYLFSDKKIELSFDREQQKNYLKRIINKALYQSKTLGEFEQKLEQNNVQFKYSSNARGVYGITFASRNVKEPISFTGSDIDRKLSWNTIAKQLNIAEPTKVVTPQITSTTAEQKSIAPDLTRVLPKLFENQEDEDTKKRRKGNDQNQDLEKD